MYKDDLWYNKLTRAIEERKSEFSDKQIAKYQIDLLLHLARRIKDYSEKSETCRSYQHTLTRLEEEMGELPESKAQRQYQKEKLREIAEYFVKHHRLAPPKYYAKKWALHGVIAGAVVGLVVSAKVASTKFSKVPLVRITFACAIVLSEGIVLGEVNPPCCLKTYPFSDPGASLCPGDISSQISFPMICALFRTSFSLTMLFCPPRASLKFFENSFSFPSLKLTVNPSLCRTE